jgi:RNA polymerase-binding transcription factor DksA
MVRAKQFQASMAETEQETKRALQRILKKRAELLRLRPVRQASPDSIDAAQALEDERVWLAVLERSDACRAGLSEAMHRLAQGQYGECLDCEERIPAARLRALPFAVRCIACQERHERGLKHRSVEFPPLLRTGTDN